MKHAWYSRLLALLLTFIMIFELVPSSVWATEATSEPGAENVTTQEAEDLSVEGEVEALRTEPHAAHGRAAAHPCCDLPA